MSTSRTSNVLTDRILRSLRPQAVTWERPDGSVEGLALRIYPSGRKVWVLSYRVPNAQGHVGRRAKQRRLTLGTVTKLGLAKARTKARAALQQLAAGGVDPAAEKQAARTQGTVGELVDAY